MCWAICVWTGATFDTELSDGLELRHIDAGCGAPTVGFAVLVIVHVRLALSLGEYSGALCALIGGTWWDIWSQGQGRGERKWTKTCVGIQCFEQQSPVRKV